MAKVSDCSVPIGAFLIMIGMMTALELRLPIVGAARSTLRTAWATGTVVFMFIGAAGLVVAVESLAGGEPTQQFVGPKWLRRGRSDAA